MKAFISGCRLTKSKLKLDWEERKLERILAIDQVGIRLIFWCPQRKLIFLCNGLKRPWMKNHFYFGYSLLLSFGHSLFPLKCTNDPTHQHVFFHINLGYVYEIVATAIINNLHVYIFGLMFKYTHILFCLWHKHIRLDVYMLYSCIATVTTLGKSCWAELYRKECKVT